MNGGLLKEHKGINLPGVAISAPCLTAKDKEDLEFGLKLGVDFIALSFVRNAKDISDVKKIIKAKKQDTLVIAKIERPEAVNVIDEILAVTDGVMVARGDLGVELGVEYVPVVQKVVILKAIKANKVVITATQMLESMTKSPMPTRAETSDVANAIFDGTDAVMLSAETASGDYPVESVQMMTQIIHQAETSPFMRFNYQFEKDDQIDLIAHSIAHAAVDILKSSQAKSIITFSMSGSTSKLISKQRPNRPIYSFAPNERVLCRLCLFWGVIPHGLKLIHDVKKMLNEGEKILIKKKIIPKGELVVVVRGMAMKKGGTNVIKLHHIGLPY
jgi:pyruvate kinase